MCHECIAENFSCKLLWTLYMKDLKILLATSRHRVFEKTPPAKYLASGIVQDQKNGVHQKVFPRALPSLNGTALRSSGRIPLVGLLTLTNPSYTVLPSRGAGEVKIMHRTVEVVTVANSEMQSEILSSAAPSFRNSYFRRQARNHEISRISSVASIVSLPNASGLRKSFCALKLLFKAIL